MAQRYAAHRFSVNRMQGEQNDSQSCSWRHITLLPPLLLLLAFELEDVFFADAVEQNCCTTVEWQVDTVEPERRGTPVVVPLAATTLCLSQCQENKIIMSYCLWANWNFVMAHFSFLREKTSMAEMLTTIGVEVFKLWNGYWWWYGKMSSFLLFPPQLTKYNNLGSKKMRAFHEIVVVVKQASFQVRL